MRENEINIKNIIMGECGIILSRPTDKLTNDIMPKALRSLGEVEEIK